jgi:hypothetical protein
VIRARPVAFARILIHGHAVPVRDALARVLRVRWVRAPLNWDAPETQPPPIDCRHGVCQLTTLTRAGSVT